MDLFLTPSISLVYSLNHLQNERSLPNRHAFTTSSPRHAKSRRTSTRRQGEAWKSCRNESVKIELIEAVYIIEPFRRDLLDNGMDKGRKGEDKAVNFAPAKVANNKSRLLSSKLISSSQSSNLSQVYLIPQGSIL